MEALRGRPDARPGFAGVKLVLDLVVFLGALLSILPGGQRVELSLEVVRYARAV